MEQLTQHDPRRIGPFEVLGRLGAGGMGLVYLARSASGRRVAIKTVRSELAEDQLFRVRFTREVEAARAVSGFYTAAVVDADPRAAVPWLATAYVPAPSLEEIVTECGPLPAQAVRWLAAGVAEALQSIHGAGLVHRDLKPSNVLVVEDGPRVIDFGIASGVSNTRLTMTNVAVGTPAYMSPEQARDSRSVTGASDLFSLASTLVFAATGHPPYHGANPVETVFMLLREGPDLEGLPDELHPLIESLMAHKPEDRPTPADIQTQLGPHLFADSDDSGTASAWLPPGAVALIERRRSGGVGAHAGSGGARRRAPERPSGPGPGAASAAAPPSPPPPSSPPPSPPPPLSAARSSSPASSAPPPPPSPVPPPPSPVAPPPSPASHSPAVPSRGPGAAPASPVPPSRPGWEAPPSHSPPIPSRPPAVPPVAAPAGPPSGGAGDRVPQQGHGEPVRLPGSQMPIGPGPHRGVPGARDGQDALVAGSPDWARPPASASGATAMASPATANGGGADARLADPPQPLSPGGPAATPGPGPGSPGGAAVAPAPAVPPAPSGDAAAPARWRPWRFRMNNDLWGSPVVRDDLLYVTSFEVHALDVASGRREFKTREVAWSMAVSSGRVLASDGPSVYALDATDGSDHWRVPTDSWIYALRAERGTVVTATRGGRVQAWEAGTGEQLWELTGAQADFETQDTGPVVHGGVVYAWGDGLLYALEARTGAELWRYPVGDTSVTGGVPVRTLPTEDGVVYVCAGSRVLALDAASGAERWRFDAPAAILCPPAYQADRTGFGGVYFADYLGTVYALDVTTGDDRWRIGTEARQSTEPVVVADGLVHLGSGAAMYTLDAVSGAPRWRFAAGESIVGSPVASGGRVHFGSEDHCLYTVDAVSGRLSWKLETGGAITGTPVVAGPSAGAAGPGGGMVFACSKDRCVYALDAARGTRQA
ncbi:PQQ-binding-like beta-propeller repeat protein [Streptomyces sp. B6B3]|uniref:outer membrane protein assembly factor BamB family protein n=1 Tax=Streptomyces sp. B6B3 TaxID=3153570 RepID=UPI00325E3B48